jgi:hypothetical protein
MNGASNECLGAISSSIKLSTGTILIVRIELIPARRLREKIDISVGHACVIPT